MGHTSLPLERATFRVGNVDPASGWGDWESRSVASSPTSRLASAGINTVNMKRKLARVESEIAAAKKRATEAFHAVPRRPATGDITLTVARSAGL